MKKAKILTLIILVILSMVLPACAYSPDYAYIESWAFIDTADTDLPADVFFICPTVYSGGGFNMPLSDRNAKDDFTGAINMEKGIYEDTRLFAPYYRQASLSVYDMPEESRERYLKTAYADVERAFDYYYANLNDNRPIILAGFSQGADMCLRLMKERFNSEQMRDQLIACYAIGWRITPEELDCYPQLRFAQSEDDTGVIISFNSEAPEIEDSIIVPAGTRTLAINPLSWQTNTETADRILNEGACFTDYSGDIKTEIDRFTGAYIDPVRGTLKVTDVDIDDYPATLDFFEDGIYHIYDYQFFYRNLQENVETRIKAYIEQHKPI